MNGQFRGQGLNRYYAQLESERALGRVRADLRPAAVLQKLARKKSGKKESKLAAQLKKLQAENARLKAQTEPEAPVTKEDALKAKYESEKLARLAQSIKGGCRLDGLKSVGNGL